MPNSRGEFTDKEKMGIWEERTEGAGFWAKTSESLSIFGTFRPPLDDSREVREFGDHSGREVKPFGGEPRSLLDKFKLT
jgi:hypothetical protein